MHLKSQSYQLILSISCNNNKANLQQQNITTLLILLLYSHKYTTFQFIIAFKLNLFNLFRKEQSILQRNILVVQIILLNQSMKLNTIQQNPKKSQSLMSKTGTKIMAANYQSPFAIPDDAQIFRMKEKEKDRKRQEKAKNDKLKIWEKGVKKTGITIRQLNDLQNNPADQQNNAAKLSLIEAAKAAIKNRVKVNQPMHDFISKKRETLLFQMLIDHKRQKINEFQEMTRLHRKGLDRAEQMLNQDMESFNSYLNDHKKEARDAIKKAETQTRKKNQKVAIIKQKLQIQADLTGKNMSKRETLQNLKKYKNFLQSLSPQLSEQQRKKRQQRMERQQMGQSFSPNVQSNPTNTNNLDDISQEQQDQEQMFFKQPAQLIDIFHSLQQSNLFLITNLKEIQQETQQVRSSFTIMKDQLGNKKTELLLAKSELQKQLQQTDQQLQQLRKTTNKDQISSYFAVLQAEIIKLSKEYGLIGLEQKHLESLFLLKQLQRRIEDQLRYLGQAKEDKKDAVHQLEKTCINQKRQRKKLKNEQEMEEKANMQKLDSSPEREKRHGRPIMQRSIIKKQVKRQQVHVQEPQEEIQKRKYLL